MEEISLEALDERLGAVAGEPDRAGSAETAFARLVAGLDYPMFIVTAAEGGERQGCLVGFVTQVSIHPPRLLVCLSDKNRTCAVALRSSHLVVHFLSEADGALATLFGHETGDETDKFTRCSWRPGPCGAPILDGTNGWVVLRIAAHAVLGDHVGFLGDLDDAGCVESRPQLGFQGVRRLQPGHQP